MWVTNAVTGCFTGGREAGGNGHLYGRWEGQELQDKSKGEGRAGGGHFLWDLGDRPSASRRRTSRGEALVLGRGFGEGAECWEARSLGQSQDGWRCRGRGQGRAAGSRWGSRGLGGRIAALMVTSEPEGQSRSPRFAGRETKAWDDEVVCPRPHICTW